MVHLEGIGMEGEDSEAIDDDFIGAGLDQDIILEVPGHFVKFPLEGVTQMDAFGLGMGTAKDMVQRIGLIDMDEGRVAYGAKEGNGGRHWKMRKVLIIFNMGAGSNTSGGVLMGMILFWRTMCVLLIRTKTPET